MILRLRAEILLIKSKEDYNRNQKTSAVFHQVLALYQFHQEKFFFESVTNAGKFELNEMQETDEFKT